MHLLCSTNRMPLSYEATPTEAADVRLVEELLDGARLGDGVTGRLFGDLAYRSKKLGEDLAGASVLLAPAERAQRWPEIMQQVEVCSAALKRVFGLSATLAGLVTRIAAKVAAYTYGLYVNRPLGRPQGHIKEL